MRDERIEAATVLWAAGIQASSLNRQLKGELDSMGRIIVEPDLSSARTLYSQKHS